MSILEWLGQFLSELWPPWVIVARTDTGVRQRNIPLPTFIKDRLKNKGTIARDCGCGFVFKMPFLDEVWELPVTYESEDLDNIEAETRDGIVYDISPVLRWKVQNPMQACFEVRDFEDSLKNEVRATILEWVNRQTDLINVERANRECTALVIPLGPKWGCRVLDVKLNSCARPWTVEEMVHSLKPYEPTDG